MFNNSYKPLSVFRASESMSYKMLPRKFEAQESSYPNERHISKAAWGFLHLAVLLTFLAFMVLDPNPSWMLAMFSAANMGIILWGIFRLYSWDLLLSPAASVFIGSGWIAFYTWGNLGARIAGDERRGRLYEGNLEYFPIVALLSFLGLVLYCWVIFGLFPRQLRKKRFNYRELAWKPYQGVLALAIAVIILIYLSFKYPFVNGYFRDIAPGSVDQWLAVSSQGFLTLALMINISVFSQGTHMSRRIMGLIVLLTSVTITISMRSRTFMIVNIINAGLFYITLRPRQVRFPILLGITGIIAVFVFGTVVKMGDSQNISLIDNLELLIDTGWQDVEEINKAALEIDVTYRTAGSEFPASVLRALEEGNRSPLYLAGIEGGLQQLPAFVRPASLIGVSERDAIYRHFGAQWIPAGGELMSTVLTSGLAMFGFPLGILIYFIVGLYVIFLWHFVQASPRLFVAYFMMGMGSAVGNLFWDSAFSLVKFLGFGWFFLFVFGSLLMPHQIQRPLEKPIKVSEGGPNA
jgi:hypothetical protein